jgi:hypothetical protein
LLTAGYAAAFSKAIAGAPHSVSTSVENELTKSFSSAEAVAQQHPQYASQITSAAKTSFLQGDDWAYTAGLVAILLGATLVFFLFPKKQREDELLAAYHAQDTERSSAAPVTDVPAPAPAAP